MMKVSRRLQSVVDDETSSGSDRLHSKDELHSNISSSERGDICLSRREQEQDAGSVKQAVEDIFRLKKGGPKHSVSTKIEPSNNLYKIPLPNRLYNLFEAIHYLTSKQTSSIKKSYKRMQTGFAFINSIGKIPKLSWTTNPTSYTDLTFQKCRKRIN